MADASSKSIEQRVARAAADALSSQHFVGVIDVFVGLGWLPASAVNAWKRGRSPNLDEDLHVGPQKLADALAAFQRWTESRGLSPIEAAYVSGDPGRRRLRFSTDDEFDALLDYRTHWMDPELPERARARLVEKQQTAPALAAIMPLNDWRCAECGGSGDLLVMEDGGPRCLNCVDLGHLVFLGAGDAALTRRATKESALSAVVVRFSRTRKRYERQGVLVEEAALERAERQCLDDEQRRARRRERDQQRRERDDVRFQSEFSAAIVREFPRCPPERADAIARHTAARGSGRVGRSAAGRAFDPAAVGSAVVAAARHQDTDYDRLLMAGWPRADARREVRDAVDAVVAGWRG